MGGRKGSCEDASHYLDNFIVLQGNANNGERVKQENALVLGQSWGRRELWREHNILQLTG